MSGCHNTQINETLSLCKHGTPVKFGCILCSLENRIDELEESYNGACKDIELLIKKINELTEHRHKQIDENRAVHKHLTLLHDQISKIKGNNINFDKKSRTCHTCFGAKFILVHYENGHLVNDCFTCKAEGVLWS